MTRQDWLGCPEVVIEDGKVSGVPIVKGSRVQADAVVENYEAGETAEEIAENFDLDLKSVTAVIHYSQAHRLESSRSEGSF